MKLKNKNVLFHFSTKKKKITEKSKKLKILIKNITVFFSKKLGYFPQLKNEENFSKFFLCFFQGKNPCVLSFFFVFFLLKF